MQWIRLTRAWTLFKGFLVVILVYAAAYVLNLVTILWVMRMSFNIGLIAVVVIFQPELRKALEQLGKGKYFGFFKGEEKVNANLSRSSADAIAKAAKAMSEVKTGALIVIEQTVSLSEIIQTGIPIDAKITSQLLINTFEKNTPLHDGAVLIKGDRIAAAACMLPLTDVEIGKELGTRHRAAVGVSEVSDSVVVIVSEETGNISIASNGNLFRKLHEKQVREMLIRNEEPEKRSLILRLRRKKNDKISE
jgi:diadenylate cyclase